VQNVGDLRISYGGQYFDVKDCKVTEQINFYQADGWVTEYLIEDRRWRWRFGEIEGNYNTKNAAGKIDRLCEQTPQELAQKLFRAMKEQRFDFSALPDDPRPEVEWIGANPAQELESLCDSLGCRLVYDPYTDTVYIRRTGEGNYLPNLLSVDQFGANLVKPAIPNGIRVVGNATRVQMGIPLTPLVEDIDGEYKAPDKLSFVGSLASDTSRTDTTWYYDETPEFDNISDKGYQKLLRKSMWRYWTVKYGANLFPVLAAYLKAGTGAGFKVENISLELNEDYLDENSLKAKRGYMLGVYRVIERGQDFFGQGGGLHENTSINADNVKYDGSISIDNNHDDPIVIFSDPIWKWDEDGDKDVKKIPDKLFLVCTFEVRDKTFGSTCSLHHFNYFQQLISDQFVGPEVIREPSLELRPVEEFDETTLTTSGQIDDNVSEDALLQKAQTIARNRSRRYDNVESGNATYQELVLASLDGAIQSIVWNFGPKGATTQIYRNSEPDFIATKYDRRVTDTEIARRAGVTKP
jgi:hypothetical protein